MTPEASASKHITSIGYLNREEEPQVPREISWRYKSELQTAWHTK